MKDFGINSFFTIPYLEQSILMQPMGNQALKAEFLFYPEIISL
jgi:hypothetical protein